MGINLFGNVQLVPSPKLLPKQTGISQGRIPFPSLVIRPQGV
jgi:hypothetical protein